MTSRWPSVVSSPTLAPLCSSSALVATVVPCTMRSVCASSWLGERCRSSARRSRPAITPIDGSSGVDAVFASVEWPLSSTATRSVKVPPTSMPIFSMARAARIAGERLPLREGWGGAAPARPLPRPPPQGEGELACTPDVATAICMLQTNPLISSLSRAAGSRFAGSPQPPPPPDSIRNTSPGRISIPTSFVFSTRCCRPSECST